MVNTERCVRSGQYNSSCKSRGKSTEGMQNLQLQVECFSSDYIPIDLYDKTTEEHEEYKPNA